MYWVIPCFCLILVLHVIKFTIPTCFYVYFISHLYTPRSLHIIQQQLLPHVTVSATYPTIVTAVLTSSYFSMDVACAFIFWLLFLSFVYLLIRQTNHLLVYRKQQWTISNMISSIGIQSYILEVKAILSRSFILTTKLIFRLCA